LIKSKHSKIYFLHRKWVKKLRLDIFFDSVLDELVKSRSMKFLPQHIGVCLFSRFLKDKHTICMVYGVSWLKTHCF